MDIAGVFENVSYKAITDGIGRLGADKTSQQLITSYLAGRSEFIVYNEEKSTSWGPRKGIGAGRPLAGYLFNAALYTDDDIPVSFQPACYSDDQLVVLAAPTEAELSKSIKTLDT